MSVGVVSRREEALVAPCVLLTSRKLGRKPLPLASPFFCFCRRGPLSAGTRSPGRGGSHCRSPLGRGRAALLGHRYDGL